CAPAPSKGGWILVAAERRFMSLENLFLADILERPDDDVPRLVYADWLEEHGQPERAEFIRVQCQIARFGNGVAGLRDYLPWVAESWKGGDLAEFLERLCQPDEQGPEAQLYRRLREREAALLKEFGKTWAEPLRATLNNSGWHRFHRGMIQEIHLAPDV